MDSILKQLYNGDLCPADQFHPYLEAYENKQKEDFARYEAFVKKLSPPLAREFTAIMDEHLETIPFEMEEMFRASFQMGARFMLEMLTDKETGNPFTA